MNSLKRAVLSILLFTSISFAFAGEDDPPIKWGEVPPEDLAMTTYAADSNATAVILCDFGSSKFDNYANIIFTRHVRIKILTPNGYSWGTQKIDYYDAKSIQHVKDIEGMTITRDAQGRTISKHLDNKSLFDEKLANGWRRIKFTLPALSPGCIVEFRYTVVTTSPLYPPDWDFQTSEPTRWSEFRFKCPDAYGYSVAWEGYEPFFVHDGGVVEESFTWGDKPGITSMWHQRWVVKDAPAIREEGFMTTARDYIMKVDVQLNSITWPNEPPHQFLETWEKIGKELMLHSGFGKQLKGYGSVSKKVKTIVSGIDSPLEKERRICDFVRSTVVWNQEHRMFASKDLDEVIESKTGNSADINLLLTLMLRDAGIEASPVILSTRGNGKVQRAYPMYDQFNYVIARATIDGTTQLLDATDYMRPANILPVRALNHDGWSINDKEKQEWIHITPSDKSITTTIANVALGIDGSLTGKIEKTFSGYGAFDERRKLAGMNEGDYIKSLFRTETTGMTCDSFRVSMRDSVNMPFHIVSWISVPTYAQLLDNFALINPMISVQMKDSPLKYRVRKFPVDISYGEESFYTLNMTLPDGYEIKELPKDKLVTLPAKSGRYSRKFSMNGNILQLSTGYELAQSVFEANQYARLKSFFESCVAMDAEQLVLQRRVSLPANESGSQVQAKTSPKGGKKQ